jgi:hypothetical protein
MLAERGIVAFVDVTVDCAVAEGCVVKIQAEMWEVNVWASAADLLKLREIRSADWDSRRSMSLGRAAGSPVWWCSDGESATLLIGPDDETWDMSLTVPVHVVDEIVAQAASGIDK